MRELQSNLALHLGGGGARAVYQVGFLRYLARTYPNLRIPILTGVSAGAINAAFLANHPGNLRDAVEELAVWWCKLSVGEIFRADPLALSGNFLRWCTRLAAGGGELTPPTRGLVNTAPLRNFLKRAMNAPDGRLTGIAQNICSGRLRAVGLTSINYTTGQSTTWVQGDVGKPWARPLRLSVATELTIENVMASSAIPLFFPAIQIGEEWYGDGGVGLTAPLSPALQLGAEQILAVSTRYHKDPTEAEKPSIRGYPPPATVIGLLFNAVFLDMLDYDALVMGRINKLLEHLPPADWGDLRPVNLFVLRPSSDLEVLAAEFEETLPRSFRYLTRGLGTKDTQSHDLLAMVLFEPDYIQRVMDMGEHDAAQHDREIARCVLSLPATSGAITV